MTEADDIELGAEPDEPTLPSGTVVDGKYTIQRLLGRGGTGTVYEAQHAVIGHRIALKIVNADRAQRPEPLARFQREAKICGTIRHPNVGQIYDVGTYDGKPYMVLELHEGQSLADVLAESILPVPAIIEITLQVLSALAAVHHAGVVHRDVKPDNVMLVRSLDGDIVVKLVDFGISKLITADIRERTLTREGSILGSPDYMSPEQLRGQEVDARTDLYAVGVLLYEAITGSAPFDAENLSDLMAAILRDPVLPPRELRDDCPEELNALILKAMSRPSDERFQSAAELARQLEQIRSALRMVPNVGMQLLRKPMPRREERATRARRMPRKVAETASAAPAPSTAIEDDETIPTLRPTAVRGRGKLLWASALIVLLGVAGTLAFRDDEQVAPPPGAAAALPAPPPPLPEAAAPEMAQTAPAVAAALAPAPDAATEAPSTNAVVTAAPATPRAARRAKRDRHVPADAPEPAPPTVEPAGPSVQEQLAEASSAFVLGQVPRAKALYQQVLERSPSQPEAWRGLGLASSRMGQLNDAEVAFERYLKLRPNAPDAERVRDQLAKIRGQP